jgi:hypothetical protein
MIETRPVDASTMRGDRTGLAPGTSLPPPSNNYATMPDETLYDCPAHDATFYVPPAGIMRFAFSDPRASGYVYALPVVPWRGSMARVEPGTRLFLPAGQHILTLYDPELTARVSITFEPH